MDIPHLLTSNRFTNFLQCFSYNFFLTVNDAVAYLKKQEKYNRSQHQIVDMSIKEMNQNCLTIDDVRLAEKNLPLQQYDAFILFAEKDIDFATTMINKVEAFGFKVKFNFFSFKCNRRENENTIFLLLSILAVR